MKSSLGITLTILLTLMSGCADNPVRSSSITDDRKLATTGDNCEELSSAERLRLSLIEDELRANRARAALAYLDALPEKLGNKPKAVYLRAEAYRDVAQYDDANKLYQSLSKGCLVGASYHGQGMVAAEQSDMDTALVNLRQARFLLAADPRVRNDYGFALLLAGHIAESKIEFETALQLSSKHPKAAQNLVLAMLIEGNEQNALGYARAISLSETELQRLRQQANVLRTQISEEHSNDIVQ